MTHFVFSLARDDISTHDNHMNEVYKKLQYLYGLTTEYWDGTDNYVAHINSCHCCRFQCILRAYTLRSYGRYIKLNHNLHYL